MNCFNGEDEYKLLKEGAQIKKKLKKMELKEIDELLKKTNARYKRYLANVDMEGLDEIESNIYKFLRIYKNETTIGNLFARYKNLIEIMIKTDQLIIDELDNYPCTAKRYRNS